MKKTMNPDEVKSPGSYAVLKNHGVATDIVVPRDFMIKTAYVRKRRNTAA